MDLETYEPRGSPPGGSGEYKLKVWQQPLRARLCSFKEENDTIDRRPIDPPPVVELQSFNTDLSELLESTAFFIRASIVHPKQIDVRGRQEYAAVKTPSGADATAGEVIQTPERLKGLDGLPGALVVFAKLSIRMPGVFRLKFTLYETSERGIEEITYSVSEPFEVFSPKLFKGMKESTPLTRHLAAQGLKVKLRTDTSVGRHSDSRKRPSTQPVSRAPSVGPPSIPNSPPPSRSRLPSNSSSNHPPYPHRRSSPSRHHGPPSPSQRSLVWRSNMLYDEQPRYPVPSPLPAYVFRGDDGLVPQMHPLPSRMGYSSAPSTSDLSAFSLSSELRRLEPGNMGQIPSPHPNSTASASSISRSYSPFSAPTSSSNSYQTRTSSIRSSSPGTGPLPPLRFSNRLDIGAGDDGLPRLPFLLPPPMPQGAGGHRSVDLPPRPGFLPQAGPSKATLPPVLGSSSRPPERMSPPVMFPPIRPPPSEDGPYR